MSFRLKTILGIALIEITLLGILITTSLYSLRASNESELMRRATTTAQLLSTMTLDAVISTDLATLQSLIDQTLKNEDLIYVRVRHHSGIVLAEGGDRSGLNRNFEEDHTARNLSDQSLDVAAPIATAGQNFGQVEIGLSTGVVEELIAASAKRLAGLAATGITLVAIFGYILGTYLSKQLEKLRRAARRVANGDFGSEMEVVGKDELADTAKSFNTMSRALAQYAREAEEARKKAEAGRAYAETVLDDAMNSMPQSIVVLDQLLQIEFANKGASALYPMCRQELQTGMAVECFLQKAISSWDLDETDTSETAFNTRFERLKARAHETWQSRTPEGRVLLHLQRPMSNGGMVLVDTDITELYDALEKNQKLELELISAQKLEALGTLACGIAHEINTPIQYINSNVQFLQQSFDEIVGFIAEQSQNADPALSEALERLDWEFLQEELPNALRESLEGVATVARIVGSVKAFSHPDGEEKTPYDLNELIENAVQVSTSQWKHVAEVSFSPLEGARQVPCYPGDLGQVLINLIVNSADAIGEEKREGLGHIAISITQTKEETTLTLTDDGPGIPEAIRERVFDMFFTTKEVGKGTGQGLAIARSVIEDRHKGKLILEKTKGRGASFKIMLPNA